MRRVLLVNEFSGLSTGYANYGAALLTRLSKDAHVAELATHCPDNAQADWKVYSNNPQSPEEVQRFNSNPLFGFGAFRFEQTLIDFKPHVVITWKDAWMDAFIHYSPLRKYFKYCLMPAVDAVPQQPEWLADFSMADGVFSYSDWGAGYLKHTTNQINVLGSAPPGVDSEIFKPFPHKSQHKQNLGLKHDALVCLTVMRNQQRKLYPDLFEAFKTFLNIAPPDVAKRAVLYCHTSFPDNGFFFPQLLVESGISHKIYFSYCCRHCGLVRACRFQDARGVCIRCNQPQLSFPAGGAGLSRDALAAVYNAGDIYVQYANSEGFGIPQVEAASCGLPIMSVDYSAMTDVVRKLGGYPIKVQRLTLEQSTRCLRAAPDNLDFATKLVEWMSLPESARLSMGYEARLKVLEHYQWDATAKKWLDFIQSVDTAQIDEQWKTGYTSFSPNMNFPENISNGEFVTRGFHQIANRPELSNSYLALRMTRDLNWQSTTNDLVFPYFSEDSALGVQPRFRNYSRDDAVKEMLNMCGEKNKWELQRVASCQH